MFKYIWLLLFLAAGFFTLKAEFDRAGYAEFDKIVFRLYYFTCLFLSIALVWSWIVFYRQQKKIPALVPLILPLLFLGLIGFIITQRNKKQQVPVFLTAGFETFRLELRIDSTYRIREIEEFSTNSHYGAFKFRGDTILLDKSHDLFYYISDTLLVKKGGYIVKLDHNGNVSDKLVQLALRNERD